MDTTTRQPAEAAPETRAGQTFCRDCFYALPQALRDALYKRMGHGYEEAYQAACDFLDAQKKRGR